MLSCEINKIMKMALLAEACWKTLLLTRKH